MTDAATVTLTRVLHSCVLLEGAGDRVLFDPCFGLFARRPWTSGLAGIRMPPPGIPPEDMAGLSLVALTHGHEDHFDDAGMARLPSRGAPVAVPDAATARRARRLGFREVHRLGPWESLERDGWKLTAVPARSPNAWKQTSWIVEMGGLKVFHGGDTAMHDRFPEIGERCRPDVGCLPINGVSLLGLRLTMGPEQAAAAALGLGLEAAVPIHAEMRFRRLGRLLYRAPGTEEAFRSAMRRVAPGVRVLRAERGRPVRLDRVP